VEPSEARSEAPDEVLGPEDEVEVAGVRGHADPVPLSGGRAVEVSEQLLPVEPAEREARGELVAEVLEPAPEALEHLFPGDPAPRLSLDEPGEGRRRALVGRHPRQEQREARLEVPAVALVLLAALLVDEARHGIREGPLGRVVGRGDALGVDVEHPAVPEAREESVDVERESGELLARRRVQVGSPEAVAGEEAPVLVEDNPVVDESGPGEEIADAAGAALALAEEHQ